MRKAQKRKTRISIMLNEDVIAGFRPRAEAAGIGHQTEINRVLNEALARKPALTLDAVRRVVREELRGK